MAIGLALLVFLNCWMTGETYKPNTIDQITYCTAWLWLSGWWKSMWTLFFKCLAMMLLISGSCRFYLLKTKWQRTTTTKNINECSENTWLVISPILNSHKMLSILISHSLQCSKCEITYTHPIYIYESTHLSKFCYCFIEINNYFFINFNLE